MIGKTIQQVVHWIALYPRVRHGQEFSQCQSAVSTGGDEKIPARAAKSVQRYQSGEAPDVESPRYEIKAELSTYVKSVGTLTWDAAPVN